MIGLTGKLRVLVFPVQVLGYRAFYAQFACCAVALLLARGCCIEMCRKKQRLVSLQQQQLNVARGKIAQWDDGSRRWSVKLQPLLYVQRLLKSTGATIRYGSVRKVAVNRWVIFADVCISIEDAGRLFESLRRIPYGVVLWRAVNIQVQKEVLSVNLQLEWIVSVA